MNWIPITRYSGFHDIPRIFFIELKGKLLLFDCRFNEAKDDYEDFFSVYHMPSLSDDEITAHGRDLAALAEKVIGEIPTSQVQFDPTRRKAVAADCLASLRLEG